MAGHAERRHRFEEAGRQPAEAAIAQRRVRLVLEDLLEREARPAQRPLGLVQQAQVLDRVLEQAADQELHRQVIDAFGVQRHRSCASRRTIGPPCDRAPPAKEPRASRGSRHVRRPCRSRTSDVPGPPCREVSPSSQSRSCGLAAPAAGGAPTVTSAYPALYVNANLAAGRKSAPECGCRAYAAAETRRAATNSSSTSAYSGSREARNSVAASIPAFEPQSNRRPEK